MDLLDDLDIPTTTPEVKKPMSSGKKEKVNMYEMEVIPSKEINTDKFDKIGHTFMVHVFAGDDNTEEVEERLIKLAGKLKEKKFVYRCDASENDIIANKIANIEGLKKEVYLPFKKFNIDLADNATMPNTFELPHNYAAQIYGPRYNDMKPGGRSVYASKVMAMLGVDCDNPIDFLLCYSPDGREGFQARERVDYKLVGTLSFYIKLAQVAGIPVYNLKNKDSLINFIKTHIQVEES